MAVKIEETTCEDFYEQVEKNGAGGILMIVVIFLEFFMPILIYMIGDYPLRILSANKEIVLNGWGWIFPILRVIEFALMVASFLVGRFLNQIKPQALIAVKIFLIVKVIFLVGIICGAFQSELFAFSNNLMQSGTLELTFEKFREIGLALAHTGEELLFRLIVSMINFAVIFGYLTFSKRIQENFLPDKLTE